MDISISPRGENAIGGEGSSGGPVSYTHLDVYKRQAHDVTVLFLGLTDVYECEGYDRTHLSIPPSHTALLSALRAAGKPVAVVFSGGSPVELPWLDQADALLALYLGY